MRALSKVEVAIKGWLGNGSVELSFMGGKLMYVI